MKICLFGDARSVHLQRLARGLAERGLEVHLVCHKPVDIPGVTVERFSVPPPGLANPRRWRGRYERYLLDFVRRFDVVNIHFLNDWGFSPQIIEEGCVVASAWGSDIVPPPGEGKPSPELTAARISLLRHAAAVTTCGPTFARTVAKFTGINIERIEVLPFDVDLELFAPAASKTMKASTDWTVGPTASSPTVLRRTASDPPAKSCLTTNPSRGLQPARRNEQSAAQQCVGTSSPNDPTLGGPIRTVPTRHSRGHRVGFFKGFRQVYGAIHLIRAIPIVLGELPETRFDMIGDGPELSRCQALASELGVADRIKWIPRQPHGKIPGWLAKWDLTVIPSVYEAFGVAALESSAAGVPVVTSRVGGLVDTVLDGVTGRLVSPCLPEELGRAIITLLVDAPLRRRMSEAGRRWAADNFDRRQVLDQWIAFFHRVAERVRSSV